MKVILLKDVKGLGKKDDVVNASDGYARNYLIPRGLGIEATESSIRQLKEKKRMEEEKKAREKKEAQELAQRLNSTGVVIKVKAGNDKIFGSVTSKEIAEKLKEQHGIDVDKRKIMLDEPIKYLGTFYVDVWLYPEVTAKLKVVIEGE